jgi:hypothetical protein
VAVLRMSSEPVCGDSLSPLRDLEFHAGIGDAMSRMHTFRSPNRLTLDQRMSVKQSYAICYLRGIDACWYASTLRHFAPGSRNYVNGI